MYTALRRKSFSTIKLILRGIFRVDRFCYSNVVCRSICNCIIQARCVGNGSVSTGRFSDAKLVERNVMKKHLSVNR